MKKTFLFALVAILAAGLFLACSQPSESTGSGTGTGGSTGGTGTTTTVDALEIVAGASVTTGGWADNANSGAGMKYPAASSITFITDALYPSAVAKRTAFTDAINTDSAKIVVVSGDIDLSGGVISDSDHSYYDLFDATTSARLHGDIVYPIGSNTAIIGMSNARVMFGGLSINAKTNIIIRNIVFYDAHGSTEYDTLVAAYTSSKASIDALSIQGASSNIWVDSCTFTDGTCVDLVRNYNHDGAFDIKQGNNITVSYVEFTNHDKVMLIAPNDSYTDPTVRTITLHHNYFHGTTQRMPRSRGTNMHVYNNYYNGIGIPANTGYALGPGIGSQFIVENNSFGTFAGTIVKYFDSSADSSATTFSAFYHSGNSPALTAANCSYDSANITDDFDQHVTAAKPFAIPYLYTLDTAATLESTVPGVAGSGKQVRINGTLY